MINSIMRFRETGFLYASTFRVLKAFTLAEVLITLGIIGVVAAMTIPAMINKTNDAELIAAWKKSYTTVAQAFIQILNDGGADYTSHTTLRDNVIPYFSVVKSCDTSGSDCWHAAGDIKTMPLQDGTQYDFVDLSSYPGFVTADGMKYVVYSDGVVNNMGWLMVDVNGDRKPNVAGKDVFAIRLRYQLKAVPFGFDSNSSDCNPPSDQGANTGLNCSAYYIAH